MFVLGLDNFEKREKWNFAYKYWKILQIQDEKYFRFILAIII